MRRAVPVALLLAIAACAVLVARELEARQADAAAWRMPAVASTPRHRPVPPQTRPRPPRALHRSHLDGSWLATGIVVAGSRLYPPGARFTRRWFFYRRCRHCRLVMARSSSSGALFARVSGRRPVWTATFRRYGSVGCARPGAPGAAQLSAHWRFVLTPGMAAINATESVTIPTRCGSADARIVWTAKPAAVPPVAEPAASPAQRS